MIRIVLYALLIWFLYQFIFRFVIPVYKTTRQVKQQFRDMQQRMQEQMDQHRRNEANAGPAGTPAEKSTSRPAGDYIDFEEIK